MQKNKDFFELIKERQSIRTFQKKDIEPEKVEKILKSVLLAPSAGNLQSYRIFEIRDEQTKFELAKAAYNQMFISEAPVCLVFCADENRAASHYGVKGRELFSIQDATIAGVYSILAVESLGLGTVWVGAFDTNEVISILKAENNLRPVAIMPVGYPKEITQKTGRKDLSEILIRI